MNIILLFLLAAVLIFLFVYQREKKTMAQVSRQSQGNTHQRPKLEQKTPLISSNAGELIETQKPRDALTEPSPAIAER